MLEESEQQKELERIYREMYRHAEDEINRFYGKYADAEGISITEAKRRVTQADIEAYEQLAKEYVKNKDFSDRANAEMRLYNATMKINRLEMLKARIGVYLVDGINTIDQYYEKVMTDRTQQEIERQAGILGETVSVADTVKRADNIVDASFYNATYSERIWSHMDNLRSEISIQLQRGLIAGIGSREMARHIKEYAYDKSLVDAHRLMVTELRRVQTDAAMDSYKASGVTRYVYMAVNPRACPVCREIDGKDFAVEDAQPGKNAPPMHPRCHCTTAPYVDEGDYNAWLNYLNQGGRTSDWNNMSPAERQKWLNPVVQSEPKTADTFTPAKDIKEAEEYARSLGLEAHYKGVSIKTANAMNESFKRGIDFCSKVRERLKMVGSGQEGNKLLKEAYTNLYMKSNGAETMRTLGYKESDIEKWAKKMAGRSVGRIGNVYAFARNMGASSRLGADGVRYGGIFVNKSWADYDTMTKSLKGDVASKFHPVGCDTVKAVFDHEMGHQLDYVLDLRNNRKIIDLYRSLSKDDIINGLSEYATVNIKEFIAEGYSEYLNNPAPRDISKQIGEIIEESARTS